MEEQAQPKWRGKSSAEVNGHAAQEVWPLLADFCNLHKVFPKVETCYQLEGIAGQIGIVRYCAGFASNHDESTIKWAKERLLMIDPIKRCLSYEVIDDKVIWGSHPKPIGNGWSGLNPYKLIGKVSFFPCGMYIFSTRPCTCGEFLSHTREQLLGDVEPMWP
ncbi:hypothetical protein ABKV19_019533 [Rosa sericea]